MDIQQQIRDARRMADRLAAAMSVPMISDAGLNNAATRCWADVTRAVAELRTVCDERTALERERKRDQ